MSFEIVGVDIARRQFRRIKDDAGRHALGSVRAGGAVLIDGMRERAPELSDEYEGTLARSVHMRSAGSLAVLVGTNHGLARLFEEGGELTPTRKKVLASDDQVFGRNVTIPAQPFVRPTADEDRGKAIAAARRTAARLVAQRAAVRRL